MHTIEMTLADFFRQVAQKHHKQLHAIKLNSSFRISQTHWYFSLPDLFAFLQQHDDIFTQVDYTQFRQLVFNSTINLDIKPYGAEIIIVDNQGKVDKSEYAMVWQPE